MKKSISRKWLFIILILSVVTTNYHVEASSTSGTINSSFTRTKICKDVSCGLFGNVNFKPTINISTPGALPITITDTGITGHAWGDEIGWINMAPTSAGVFVNATSGVLSGEAYSSSGSWINFAPTYSGSGPQVGVRLTDNGSGSNFDGWAWVSGAHGGWMKFDCTGSGMCVKTDWRAVPYRTTYQCSDGIDNDGDGLIDYPADPGCTSTTDNDELNNPSGGGGGGTGIACIMPNILVNGVCKTPTPVTTTSTPTVVPTTSTSYTATICEPYLKEYIQLGSKNNILEVKKLETFLNTYAGEKLLVNGVYDQKDFEAVKRFQSNHFDVLSFWKLKKPTGYVYIATQKMINRIYCQETTKVTCPYFNAYQKTGNENNEVLKIKKFLNKTQQENLKEDTVFDQSLQNAIKKFQNKYAQKILVPWGLKNATGYWYQSTRKTAEDLLGCFVPVRLDNGKVIE